jgi:hypothetical protein
MLLEPARLPRRCVTNDDRQPHNSTWCDVILVLIYGVTVGVLRWRGMRWLPALVLALVLNMLVYIVLGGVLMALDHLT